jgi:vacuolar-type H+-ATPase subunit I/STV1
VNSSILQAIAQMLIKGIIPSTERDKEHRAVEELKQQIAGLTARLKGQDSKIQKVSDQIQLTKPILQLVRNHQ